eukprot:454063_1
METITKLIKPGIPHCPICGQYMISVSRYNDLKCAICGSNNFMDGYMCNMHQKLQNTIICKKCCDNNANQLRHFSALIIQPPLIFNKRNCNSNIQRFDADELSNKFKSFHYHLIQNCQNEQCTPENINKLLEERNDKLKRVSNQLTVFCYSGHGVFYRNQSRFYLKLATHKQSIEAYKLFHFDLILKQLMSHHKYRYLPYKHDIVLLLNACHSGSVTYLIESYKTQKYFKIGILSFWWSVVSSLIAKRRENKMLLFSLLFGSLYGVFNWLYTSYWQQNICLIGSCLAEQKSLFWCPVSPFCEYALDGFNSSRNPLDLYGYITDRYTKPNPSNEAKLVDLNANAVFMGDSKSKELIIKPIHLSAS